MYGLIHGIYTLILLICFIGIFMWAYSSKRKKVNEDIAKQILNDDDINQ